MLTRTHLPHPHSMLQEGSDFAKAFDRLHQQVTLMTFLRSIIEKRRKGRKEERPAEAKEVAERTPGCPEI